MKQISFYDDRFYKYQPDPEVEAIYLPSVTTKLGIVAKPFLAKWRGDIGNREADLRMYEAQNRGKRIHHAWEVLCQGGVVIYNPWECPNYSDEDMAKMEERALKKGMDLFVLQSQNEMLDVWKLKQWNDIVKPEHLEAEVKLFSLIYNEAGTADNVMFINGGKYSVNGRTPIELVEGNYVVDLKTGNAMDDNYDLQVASYAEMCEEMGLYDIQGGLIIHTGSKTKTGIAGLATKVITKDELVENFKAFRKVADVWEWKNKGIQPKLFDFPAIIKLETEDAV